MGSAAWDAGVGLYREADKRLFTCAQASFLVPELSRESPKGKLVGRTPRLV